MLFLSASVGCLASHTLFPFAVDPDAQVAASVPASAFAISMAVAGVSLPASPSAELSETALGLDAPTSAGSRASTISPLRFSIRKMFMVGKQTE